MSDPHDDRGCGERACQQPHEMTRCDETHDSRRDLHGQAQTNQGKQLSIGNVEKCCRQKQHTQRLENRTHDEPVTPSQLSGDPRANRIAGRFH